LGLFSRNLQPNIPLFAVSYLSHSSNYYCFNLSLEQNQQVFVYKEDLLAIKGRYETALADNDEISWSVSINKFILKLLIVSICNLL